MDPIVLVLRALHIGAGVLWVGAAWTFYLFVGPSLRALPGEAQQKFMAHLTNERRWTQVVLAATLVAIVAGAILYVIRWQQVGAAWFQTGYGIALTIGAIAALITALIGPLIVAPAFRRLGQLGQQIASRGGPPTDEESGEMGRVGRRLQVALAAASALLAVSVFFMATAQSWG